MIKYLKGYESSLKFFYLIGFLAIFVMNGCDIIRMKDKETPESQEQPLARVGNQMLFPDDVEDMSRDLSTVDSASIVERYVKSWIRKQLLINEAASRISFNEAEIERKMLDYRYALMVYEYEKLYVNDRLDTKVKEEDIESYYKENLDNFELKQNIIRGIYVKMPIEAPKNRQVKQWVQSKDKKDQQELKSYCYRFANSYSLEDSVWLNFDEVVNNTPLAGIPNKVQFLKENSFIETADENFIYLLKIKDYKIVDELSPLEFVRDQISQIILNKRKVKLAQQLEEDVFNKAEESNDFEIYSRKTN